MPFTSNTQTSLRVRISLESRSSFSDSGRFYLDLFLRNEVNLKKFKAYSCNESTTYVFI